MQQTCQPLIKENLETGEKHSGHSTKNSEILFFFPIKIKLTLFLLGKLNVHLNITLICLWSHLRTRWPLFFDGYNRLGKKLTARCHQGKINFYQETVDVILKAKLLMYLKDKNTTFLSCELWALKIIFYLLAAILNRMVWIYKLLRECSLFLTFNPININPHFLWTPQSFPNEHAPRSSRYSHFQESFILYPPPPHPPCIEILDLPQCELLN